MIKEFFFCANKLNFKSDSCRIANLADEWLQWVFALKLEVNSGDVIFEALPKKHEPLKKLLINISHEM